MSSPGNYGALLGKRSFRLLKVEFLTRAHGPYEGGVLENSEIEGTEIKTATEKRKSGVIIGYHRILGTSVRRGDDIQIATTVMKNKKRKERQVGIRNTVLKEKGRICCAHFS